MNPFVRARGALYLALMGLLLVTLAPAGSASGQSTKQQSTAHQSIQQRSAQQSTERTMARKRAKLRVSPGRYVGGQKVTFAGNLGRPGRHRLHLQTHMGRPGDAWTNLDAKIRARTRPNGSFRFSHIAPSMFGIKMRVVSGRAHTPPVKFNARSQDLVLSAPGQVAGGEEFTIRVDTTPILSHRPDLPPPAFSGRTLTLQQRVNGDAWQTLDTTRTSDNGNGTFQVTGSGDDRVYRVREEAITSGGNSIGWFPSFPLLVDNGSGRSQVRSDASGTQTSRQAATDASLWRSSARAGGAVPTAGSTHKWGATLWDFAWEFGESLNSRPYRGTDRTGGWLDSSNGTGRAAKHNGGLILDSQRDVDGQGDRGTTALTLQGQPMKYGRWETKLRMKAAENNTQDYRVRAELIPDDPADYRCGANNITIAEVTAHGSRVVVGAKSMQADRQWTYAKPLTTLKHGGSAAFAVEVTKKHISWFLNGRVIASVKSRTAVSDVPMTMRLSMVGNGQDEMNRTMAISDWQRGWPLGHGRQDAHGHALSSSALSGGC
jgi:hypothetical protein